MKRRDLITLLGGTAAAWPLAARAQQTARSLRVGFVGVQPRDTPIYVAFRKRMAELGYREGKYFTFEYIQTPSIDAYDASFRELVSRKPDIVIAAGNEPALRLRARQPAHYRSFFSRSTSIRSQGVMWRVWPDLAATSLEFFVHPLELAAKRVELVRESFRKRGSSASLGRLVPRSS